MKRIAPESAPFNCRAAKAHVDHFIHEDGEKNVIRANKLFSWVLLTLCVTFAAAAGARAQEREPPGKPIGKVSVLGDLVVLELDQDALGRENLFDLGKRTLRFTPSGSGYHVENVPLRWDADFGTEISTHQVTLKNLSFPFSGKSWNSFSVG